MKRRLLVVAVALLVGAGLTVVAPVSANHGATLSDGIYRMPYVDGTSFTVNNDSHNHSTAYDFAAGQHTQIVAAASGWIRAIVDHNGNDPGAGDGLDAQDPPQPQDDSLEHACLSNDPANTVSSNTICSDYNNYVWIEHPNGEYTKYSHVGTGTTTALGWQEDDWINAGQVLGLENDPGAASCGNCGPDERAFHLHWEVAVPNTPGDELEWSELGGFIQNGSRVQAVFCDVPGGDLIAGSTNTANPCSNQVPTADAGGPYIVDEGSVVVLDGTASSDPDGTPLTFAWAPEDVFDDASLAQPTYTAIDDSVIDTTLTVYDQIEATPDTDSTTITVQNVAPTVSAVGASIVEGATALVSATVTDPGALDTLTATIDWGDGSALEEPTPGALAAGVTHAYGDNGTYTVTVTVTDDDGGVGFDAVDVTVSNLAPNLVFDVSGQVSFPGGDFFVLGAGDELDLAADGSDAGSDDLLFDWSTGTLGTHYNNELSPDPAMSPFGIYPFAASDGTTLLTVSSGVTWLSIELRDDDGGSDSSSAGAIVTGTAGQTRDAGWWKHQYSGQGLPHIDPVTAGSYLAIVDAVSSVFSEQASALTAADAHAVLSPTEGDRRARVRAELLVAWLHFASGAVAHDATVPLGDGATIGFLDLLFEAESVILDQTSTSTALENVERNLHRVRHAS